MKKDKVFSLRLPESLLEQLARLAKTDMRSINSEILYLLMEAVEAREARCESPVEPFVSTPHS